MTLVVNEIDKIFLVLLLLISSLYLRILLQVVGQSWIKTIAHTSTLLLLPILTYIITSVISGNIALSLGMVGALSIVRFRNPVRSPLELSVYFCAITMGITAAVSYKWLILLIGAVTLVAIALYAIHKTTIILSLNPFFMSSFSEGNQTSMLSVTATSEIQELDTSILLSSKNISEGKISYILIDNDFAGLKELEVYLRKNRFVDSIQLNR